MNKALRWILVLPTALICAWIAYIFTGYIISKAMFDFIINTDGTSPFTNIKNIIGFITSNVACGCSFVYFGTYIAPSHKETTAISLTAIISTILIIAIILNFTRHIYDNAIIYSAILGIISSITTCILLSNKSE